MSDANHSEYNPLGPLRRHQTTIATTAEGLCALLAARRGEEIESEYVRLSNMTSRFLLPRLGDDQDPDPVVDQAEKDYALSRSPVYQGAIVSDDSTVFEEVLMGRGREADYQVALNDSPRLLAQRVMAMILGCQYRPHHHFVHVDDHGREKGSVTPLDWAREVASDYTPSAARFSSTPQGREVSEAPSP